MKKLLSAVMIVGLFFLAGPANAATFAENWDAIEYAAGTGTDQALLIIDFGDTSSADSYLFGFNFTDDDTVTGYDMISTVGTEWDGSSTMVSGTLYYVEVEASWGTYISDIYYNGESTASGTYWEYFVSETVSGDFQGWTSSSVGASNRILEDGSWDGWYNPGFNSEGTPSVVPVPAAVWLLGSGLIGLIGIRRRNK